jgi:hypothetical protein
MVVAAVAPATAARVAPVNQPVVPGYELTIVSPVNRHGFAMGINNAGVVIADCYDEQWNTHGYAIGKQGARDLGPGTVTGGINNAGEVCGQMDLLASWWPKNRKDPVLIDTISNYYSTANAISDSNKVVGGVMIWLGWGAYVQPYVYDGTLHLLSDEVGTAMSVNNQGLVGGWVYRGWNTVPVLWTRSKTGYSQIDLSPPAGAQDGYIDAVDEQGNAVGYSLIWSADGSYTCKATIWEDKGDRRTAMCGGTFLPAFRQNSWAQDINSRGQIVGEDDAVACLWENGLVYDLNNLVADTKGCMVFAAMGINDSGQIACRAYYYATGMTITVLLTPIQ